MKTKIEEVMEEWHPECGKLPNSKNVFDGGCGKLFTEEDSNDMYRCADCNAFFHRKCIRKHFEQEPIEDLMKEVEKWKPAVIELCEKANLNKDVAEQFIGYIHAYIKVRVEEGLKNKN